MATKKKENYRKKEVKKEKTTLQNKKSSSLEKDTPHFIGHRRRLKKKFIESPTTVGDYELIEIILFSSFPRKDTKPLAKLLLKEMGNISGIIYSETDKLRIVKGVTENTCIQFLLLKELIRRVLRQDIIGKHVLNSWSKLIEYLQTVMGSIKTEQFRIIFLNKKNIIITDEIQSEGTIDQTSVYPREIVKRALFHESSAIILVHNHPSGDPKPSQADITLTEEIVKACESVNIIIHDHVIIGKKRFFSFKSECLIK